MGTAGPSLQSLPGPRPAKTFPPDSLLRTIPLPQVQSPRGLLSTPVPVQDPHSFPRSRPGQACPPGIQERSTRVPCSTTPASPGRFPSRTALPGAAPGLRLSCPPGRRASCGPGAPASSPARERCPRRPRPPRPARRGACPPCPVSALGRGGQAGGRGGESGSTRPRHCPSQRPGCAWRTAALGRSTGSR